MFKKSYMFSALIAKVKSSSSIFLGLLLVLNLTSSQSQDYWELVNSPDSVNIFDMAVDEEGSIYLVCPYSNGDITGIFRSDDNCETWQRKVSGMFNPNNPYPRSIAADNSGTLIVGCNGCIYKSVDRGENWYEVYPEGYSYYKAEFGYDSIFLLGGGYGYGIVRSGDNGLTWEPVLNYGNFEPVYESATTGICFGPDGNIYACSRTFVGGSGSVYVSEDLGLTWSVFFNNGYAQFRSIGFDQNGRLLVGSSGLYRYDFQLESWEFLTYNMVPVEMLIIGDSSIYLACPVATGGFGGVAFSNDIGETYTPLNSGMQYPDAYNFSIDVIGRILVSGIGHRLYRSYDTLVTGIEYQEILIKQSNFQFYPDPFRNDLTLRSNFNKPATIAIYNSSGRIITETTLEPSEVKILSGQIKSPGIYFIRVKTDQYVYTYKVLRL